MMSESETSVSETSVSETSVTDISNLSQIEAKEYQRYPIEFDRISTTFFNEATANYISCQTTALLKGVHPDKKNIIVSNKNILSVMDSIYNQNSLSDVKELINMTIAYIVEYIKTEFETIENNDKLNIEVLKYTGEYGIRKYPILKMREKRPLTGVFNMRY